MTEYRVIYIGPNGPFQRGEDYGTQASDEIGTAVAAYQSHFSNTRNMDWNRVREAAGAHITPVEEALPELMEELRGIAAGSKQDILDIMAINCRYELLHYPFEKECTSFALLSETTEDGHVYVGQNWDNRPFAMTHSVILHTTLPDGTRIMGLTEGGQLSRNGISTKGIGLAANSLRSSRDFAGVGIPVSILRRHLLSLNTAAQMEQAVINAPRSVSVNYMLADAQNMAVDVEALSFQPHIFRPKDGIITHANHILGDPSVDISKGGRFRGERLRELLERQHGHITLDYIMACLKDHQGLPESICSHISQEQDTVHKLWQTNASIIYDLTALKGWICWGPPCQGEYKEYVL